MNLIGPYTITTNKVTGEKLTLWALTMIDPASGWFEMHEIKVKEEIEIVNLVEIAWLACYPWSSEIIYGNGTEFMGEFAKMIENDCCVK